GVRRARAAARAGEVALRRQRARLLRRPGPGRRGGIPRSRGDPPGPGARLHPVVRGRAGVVVAGGRRAMTLTLYVPAGAVGPRPPPGTKGPALPRLVLAALLGRPPPPAAGPRRPGDALPGRPRR